MINRRGWWLEGKGGWVERGGPWMGTFPTARPALPPDPDAFANYLFVYFRGVQNASPEPRSGVSPQTSRIAGLLRWIWLIWGELFHPVLSLVHLLALKMHIHPQTDIEQMLQGCCEPLNMWDVAHQRQIGAQLQSRYIQHHMSSGSQIPTSCMIRKWL